MQNKSGDVFCSRLVNVDKIKSACPQLDMDVYRMLLYYIQERYAIRLAKEAGEPQPWTDDPVLQHWRFTNIRREHDRESKWLIEHISTNPELSYRDKLLNTIMFRLFNRHQTAEKLGLPIKFTKNFDPEKYRGLCSDPDHLYFTNVFYTSGLKMGLERYCEGEDCVPMRVLWFIDYLIKHNSLQKLSSKHITGGGYQVYKLLTKFEGIGAFMGYQLFVDFTYIPEFPVSENSFVVAGPGCKAGLDLLFTSKGGLNYEECLFWLVDVINKELDFSKVFTDLPEYDQKMNVMSLENCFCELQKYYKAYYGLGKPKNTYKPFKEESDERN